MRRKVLSPDCLELLRRLEKNRVRLLAGWILAGGTGLALRLGHRVSDDLDFFRADALSPLSMREPLGKIAKCEVLQELEHTLTLHLMKTKLSFFRVKAPFLFPATPWRCLAIADMRDIALMKLAAISGRGCRKDFVDLHEILHHGNSLQALFDLLPRKYGAGKFEAYHILKSLTYFKDAEDEPMPKMLKKFEWEKCKAYFIREAHAIVLE